MLAVIVVSIGTDAPPGLHRRIALGRPSVDPAPCDSAAMADERAPQHPSQIAVPQRAGSGALARLQRWLAAAVLVGALGWLLVWWPISKTLAISGCVLIALGHAWVLAFECAASAVVNHRCEPGPQPNAARWLRAWAIECLSTPRVFYWRQPFFSHAVPDYLPEPAVTVAAPRRGVVLVHGFVCNRGFWTPWLKWLRDAGHPFVAVNLEPIVTSIDDYVPAVERAVRLVTHATGQPPMLVCHSMGGLVARAWLRQNGPDALVRVQHIITIGSPHHGTWLGNWSRQQNGRQMARGSEWLSALNQHENQGSNQAVAVRFTCWYSDCDNIVFPTSTATLAGADNRLLSGVPHVALAFQPEVMRATFALLIDRKELSYVA